MTLSKRELNGIAAAPGLAQGPIYIFEKREIDVPRFVGKDPTEESEKLKIALKKAKKQIIDLKNQLEADAPDEAAVFDAHAMMLEDPALLNNIKKILSDGANIEAAWIDSIEFFAAQLESIPDPTLSARAADIRDVGQRVLRLLLGIEEEKPVLEAPSIIIAEDLSPSETVTFDKEKVLGFCTAAGGPTSHTAILAKALGIPAIVCLGEEILNLDKVSYLLIDGFTGKMTINPDEGTLNGFEQRTLTHFNQREIDIKLASNPAVTIDGHQVEIVANIGSPDEAATAIENGAEGVGLLRTEFLFLERKTEPDEGEQYQAYKRIFEVMENRPVVVRTIDVGGDKEIPYLNLGQEANPFLGWRAIRMCIDEKEFFKIQLRALLRAGAGHDLRIMFPMIATIQEVSCAKEMLEEARQELVDEGQTVPENFQVGIMVEIPSVALLADHFSRHVDFFSIGTNDLTQYTMAADRGNPKVSHLSDPCHPAVLRQIKYVIEQAHLAGRWVGLCGEMAGDIEAIPLLLGLELDEFSMTPHAIPGAKSLIRKLTLEDARRLAEVAVSLETAEAVRDLVQNYLNKTA